MAGSDLKLRGNTRRDLIASLTGHTTFDGGQGMINITEIKNAALAVAKLAGGTRQGERMARSTEVPALHRQLGRERQLST